VSKNKIIIGEIAGKFIRANNDIAEWATTSINFHLPGLHKGEVLSVHMKDGCNTISIAIVRVKDLSIVIELENFDVVGRPTV
jgi:hypothetical protein